MLLMERPGTPEKERLSVLSGSPRPSTSKPRGQRGRALHLKELSSQGLGSLSKAARFWKSCPEHPIHLGGVTWQDWHSHSSPGDCPRLSTPRGEGTGE